MSETGSKKHDQLFARRAEIEAHLAALLEQSGSGASVEQFAKFIYEKGSVIPFGDFLTAAFCQFPTLRRDVDIGTRLAVITDAWNYFPHCALGGKCPAETVSRDQRNALTSSLEQSRDHQNP
jgi:hypothetical protein